MMNSICLFIFILFFILISFIIISVISATIMCGRAMKDEEYIECLLKNKDKKQLDK